EEVETGGVTQCHDRRRGKGLDRRIAEAAEMLLGALDQVEYAHSRFRSIFPGLKPDERDGGILAPTGKTETGYGEYRLHNIALFGQQLLAHGVHGLLGTLHGRARRPQHLDEHDALVLVGQEGTGQLAE